MTPSLAFTFLRSPTWTTSSPPINETFRSSSLTGRQPIVNLILNQSPRERVSFLLAPAGLAERRAGSFEGSIDIGGRPRRLRKKAVRYLTKDHSASSSRSVRRDDLRQPEHGGISSRRWRIGHSPRCNICPAGRTRMSSNELFPISYFSFILHYHATAAA